MEDLTGRQFGPYQIVAPLGEGGMAAVYKAYQPRIERYVALKILPRYFANDPQFVGRFEQEAKVLAKLLHPHILPVHDYGEADGYTYIVMPFVESGTLADLLHGEPLPLPKICQVIAQVGDALNYAHQRGIVHRDVKPSNILMDPSGNCLLTDFGIARMVESTVHFTRTGGIVGTPAYMSPEQIQGEELDGRSDIYSLGIVLYEMATGRPPYRAETPPAIFVKHLHDPLPPPRTLNPALPEAVERVILKALAKKREDRYATAGSMVHALQAAAEAAAVAPARPEGSATTAGLPRPRATETAIVGVGSAIPAESPITPLPVAVGLPQRQPGNLKWVLVAVGVVGVVAVIGAVIGLVVLGSLLGSKLGGGGVALNESVTLAAPSPVASIVVVSKPTDTPAASASPAPPTSSPPPAPLTSEVMPTPKPSMTGVAKGNPTNLYRGPGEEYGQIGAIEKGTNIALLGRNAQGNWLKIRSERGIDGWVSADQVEAHMPLLDIPLAAEPAATRTRPRPTNTPPSVKTPEPTLPVAPLPGTETVRLTNLARSIPWLPLDKNALPGTFYYSFNVNKPPFDNRLVRQAFVAAIDRQVVADLANSLGAKNARPATTFTPPETLGRDLYGEVGLLFDPAQARALLAEAGYPDSQGFPSVTLVTNRGGGVTSGANAQIADAVAAMWRENLKVDVKVEVVDDWQAYLDLLVKDTPAIYRLGWAADVNDPDNFLNALFHSQSEAQYGHFADAEFDRLVEQAAASSDPATRQALYIQAEHILCQDQAAIVPLYHNTYQSP